MTTPDTKDLIARLVRAAMNWQATQSMRASDDLEIARTALTGALESQAAELVETSARLLDTRRKEQRALREALEATQQRDKAEAELARVRAGAVPELVAHAHVYADTNSFDDSENVMRVRVVFTDPQWQYKQGGKHTIPLLTVEGQPATSAPTEQPAPPSAAAAQPVAVRVRRTGGRFGGSGWRYFDFDPSFDLNRPGEEVQVLCEAAAPPAAPEPLSQRVAELEAALRRGIEIAEACIVGIGHLDKLAREWEPDHSSGADRAGWVRAKDARNDADVWLRVSARAILAGAQEKKEPTNHGR